MSDDSPVSSPASEVADIRILADLCRRAGVQELEASDGERSIRLLLSLAAPLDADAAPIVATGQAEAPGLEPLRSQFVGVFHGGGDAAPAMPVAGQVVKAGDVIGVVAAMGLQHEIRVERDGIIERFMVEDGTPIEYGQPLLELR